MQRIARSISHMPLDGDPEAEITSHMLAFEITNQVKGF